MERITIILRVATDVTGISIVDDCSGKRRMDVKLLASVAFELDCEPN